MGNLWTSRELMRKHAEMTIRELMDHRATDGSRIRRIVLVVPESGAYHARVELTTDPENHDPNNPDEVGAVE